ncbi:hypothetical protein AX15_004384 [Amanita polypyramis BW_CC]|nr:hypothetical protein AX15_004384 [Amanita polypyramis BW_CC]
MWDVSRAGTARLERRTKDHIRSINQLSISHAVHHYCVTGSADGDLRIWDLRDMSKSLMRVHHPTSVRSVAFSPSLLQPLQAIVGLDNGSIYRWDLKMGQRGLLDRLLVAHTTPVTSLAWREPPGTSESESADNGMGWFASGGLDRCVKVWDLTVPGSSSHIPPKPTYTLHPRFPVRHVLWRPGHDCEIAVISNPELASTSTKTDVSQLPGLTAPFLSRPASMHALDSLVQVPDIEVQHSSTPPMEGKGSGFVPTADDTIEIWDVRRGWIAKWSVRGSGTEGSLTDIDFADSHAIWTLHSSGAFSQFDLRDASRPIDSVSRVALTWEASGSVTFVSDRKSRFEVPYDDVRSEVKPLAEKLRMHIKTLGDPQVQPQLQNIGTQVMPRAATDLESFKRLAQKYTLSDESRKSICVKNAQAAIEAGKEETAQIWLLLAGCLEDVFPQLPPMLPQIRSPREVHTQPLPTPASARHSQSYFPLSSGKPLDGGQPQKTSPGRGSVKSTESTKYAPQRSSSQSASRHLTPASSASSSPRHGHVHLPPITPRRPSFFGQRTTADISSSGRRPSTYRRLSIAASATHATSSPAIDKDSKPSSGPSLRHVGEGALDDSDSSSGNDSDVGSAGTAGNWSDDEANLRPPLMSPTLLSQQRIAAPSPLSRVAGRQRWTDEDGDMNDDDEATSPSPQSTDTDEDGHVASLKRQHSGRRVSGRYKSRSRSSTVASLAASMSVPFLIRQNSISSIRTVVAGDVVHGDADGTSLVKPDETIRDLNSRASEVTAANAAENVEPEVMINFEHFTERRTELVQAEEKRLREIGWRALRHALETLAEHVGTPVLGLSIRD